MGVLVALAILIGFPICLIRKIYVRHKANKKEFALAVTVRTFIRENGLDECRPGFYGDKEKLLARQLGIDRNTAYQLISRYQRPVKNRES